MIVYQLGLNVGNGEGGNMWKCSELKDAARKRLSGRYRDSFLVTLAAALTYIFFPIRLFAGYSFQIGKARYFTVNSKYLVTVKEMEFGFKNQYSHLIYVQLLRDIKIVLWSLLAVVPGVVKCYEYRLIPYVLAENPTISTNRAFEISRELTRGEKANLFLLDLSFAGWYALGVLTLGIGLLFLYPYTEATFAEFYRMRREVILEAGRANHSELCGVEQYKG